MVVVVCGDMIVKEQSKEDVGAPEAHQHPAKASTADREQSQQPDGDGQPARGEIGHPRPLKIVQRAKQQFRHKTSTELAPQEAIADDTVER
jgi:hypothetical protein